jgi:hypothetical protein
MPGLSPKDELLAALILISICGFVMAMRLPDHIADDRATLYTIVFSAVFTVVALVSGLIVLR